MLVNHSVPKSILHYDKDILQEATCFLSKVVVGEDDPGLFIAWNMDILQVVVTNINNGMISVPAHALFTSAPGNFSANSFALDVVRELRNAGTGISMSFYVIAPLDISQYGRVRECLSLIEASPFFQAISGILPVGVMLATCYTLKERNANFAIPANRFPPNPPLHQLFN